MKDPTVSLYHDLLSCKRVKQKSPQPFGLWCWWQDNMPIGSSLYDEEGAKIVPEILAKAEKLGASFGSIFW